MQEARSLRKSVSVNWEYNPRMRLLWKIRTLKEACYKKHADEAMSKVYKEKNEEGFPKTILKKEVETESSGGEEGEANYAHSRNREP